MRDHDSAGLGCQVQNGKIVNRIERARLEVSAGHTPEKPANDSAVQVIVCLEFDWHKEECG
jgi:hypothetical protein